MSLLRFDVVRAVEDRGLAVLIAGGAEVLAQLYALFAWLENVDRDARIVPLRLIALLLCRPVFKAHDLCFQFVFRAQQRRMVLLYGEDQALKIDGRLEPHVLIVHLRQRLRALQDRVEALKARVEVDHGR